MFFLILSWPPIFISPSRHFSFCPLLSLDLFHRVLDFFAELWFFAFSSCFNWRLRWADVHPNTLICCIFLRSQAGDSYLSSITSWNFFAHARDHGVGIVCAGGFRLLGNNSSKLRTRAAIVGPSILPAASKLGLWWLWDYFWYHQLGVGLNNLRCTERRRFDSRSQILSIFIRCKTCINYILRRFFNHNNGIIFSFLNLHALYFILKPSPNIPLLLLNIFTFLIKWRITGIGQFCFNDYRF